MKPLLILLISSISFTACGQTPSNSKSNSQNIKTENKMDLSKISNENVKNAMVAWQNGDSKTFLSFFTENPKLTDDGNPRDFAEFIKSACGHEKFLTIDKIENEGKNIVGNFNAGPWGTFIVFFNFHQNADGKFDRLDIGQAK